MVTLLNNLLKRNAWATGGYTLIQSKKCYPSSMQVVTFFFNAKSCHLYLQGMLTLRDKMNTSEYETFTTMGYFIIGRLSVLYRVDLIMVFLHNVCCEIEAVDMKSRVKSSRIICDIYRKTT